MKPLQWIIGYIKMHKAMYVLSLCLTVVVAALGLVNPFLLGRIVDEVFEQGKTEALTRFLFMMIGVTALRSILSYTFKYLLEHVSQRVVYSIRQDVYHRVEAQSFGFFDSNRVGDIMSRMTGDLQAVERFVSTTIYMIIENLLTFMVAVILMFTLSWQMTLVLIAIAPIIAFLALKQGKAIRPAFVKIREQFSVLNTVCQENISGNRVVKAFTREKYEIEKFEKENRTYYDTNINANTIWTRFLPIQEFLAGSLSAAALLAGGVMVILGHLQLWQLVTINSYLWAINGPMRMMGWLVNDFQRFLASLDKVLAMMKTPVSISNPKNPVAAKSIRGDVQFKNVSFDFSNQLKKTEVLKNVSFSVKAGQTVGIVGPTGAGKTTMMNLLCRFYDVTGGEILVDGINVKKYDLKSLRRGIASSMQDVFLFSDTIEGNISYGVPEAPMETVIESAKTANAHGFITEMTEGYDTIVGERGVGLSGGQKQRLSLARAIAPDPSILILDDTTSAVDMETEHDIQTALEEKHGSKTKFIIAHRISSVRHADLILVIVDGKIIERGTHDGLIKSGGYYNSLFEAQYGDYGQVRQLLAENAKTKGAS